MEYTNNFAAEVLAYPGKTLVVWGAPWCVPCKSLEPMVEKFSQQIHVVKVNVDLNSRDAQQYGVSGVPVVMLFDHGTPTSRIAGKITPDKLKELIG